MFFRTVASTRKPVDKETGIAIKGIPEFVSAREVEVPDKVGMALITTPGLLYAKLKDGTVLDMYYGCSLQSGKILQRDVKWLNYYRTNTLIGRMWRYLVIKWLYLNINIPITWRIYAQSG